MLLGIIKTTLSLLHENINTFVSTMDERYHWFRKLPKLDYFKGFKVGAVVILGTFISTKYKNQFWPRLQCRSRVYAYSSPTAFGSSWNQTFRPDPVKKWDTNWDRFVVLILCSKIVYITK